MVCNKDCFNCIYGDCVNDRLDIDDFINDEVHREVQLNRNRSNRYVSNHREECRQKSIKYYYENKDKCNQNSSKYAKENKERVAATKRKRYAENPELYKQKQRDYRARKKENEIH